MLKKLLTAIREHRLAGKRLRKLDADDRSALITLGLTALLCALDGEISDADEDELQDAWLAYRVARSNTP